MKSIILLAMTFVTLSASAAELYYKLDNSEGNYGVKSCRIYIAEMGLQSDSIMKQLVKKGYIPIVSKGMLNRQVGMNKGVYVASDELNKNQKLSDDLILGGDLTSLYLNRIARLQLSEAGKNGDILAQTTKETSSENEVFDVQSLPNCMDN